MAFVFNIAPLAGYMDTVQNDTTPSSSSRSVSPVEFQEPPPAYHTIFSTTNTGTDNERPPSRALAIATHNSNGGSEDSETMREQHFNNQRASFSFTRNIDLEAQRIPRPTAQNTRRTGRSNRGQDVAVSKKIPYKELLWMASDVAIWIIAGLSTLAFLIMIGVITAQSIASFRHKGNYVLGNSMMVPQ